MQVAEMERVAYKIIKCVSEGLFSDVYLVECVSPRIDINGKNTKDITFNSSNELHYCAIEPSRNKLIQTIYNNEYNGAKGMADYEHSHENKANEKTNREKDMNDCRHKNAGFINKIVNKFSHEKGHYILKVTDGSKITKLANDSLYWIPERRKNSQSYEDDEKNKTNIYQTFSDVKRYEKLFNFNEIESLRAVKRHPHIVSLINSWTQINGEIFFSIEESFTKFKSKEKCKKVEYCLMEYLSGPDLMSLLDRHGAFPHAVTVYYSACMFSALCYLRQLEIQHNDISLNNVVLSFPPTTTLLVPVKLIDFGNSTFRSQGHNELSMNDSLNINQRKNKTSTNMKLLQNVVNENVTKTNLKRFNFLTEKNERIKDDVFYYTDLKNFAACIYSMLTDDEALFSTRNIKSKKIGENNKSKFENVTDKMIKNCVLDNFTSNNGKPEQSECCYIRKSDDKTTKTSSLEQMVCKTDIESCNLIKINSKIKDNKNSLNADAESLINLLSSIDQTPGKELCNSFAHHKRNNEDFIRNKTLGRRYSIYSVIKFHEFFASIVWGRPVKMNISTSLPFNSEAIYN